MDIDAVVAQAQVRPARASTGSPRLPAWPRVFKTRAAAPSLLALALAAVMAPSARKAGRWRPGQGLAQRSRDGDGNRLCGETQTCVSVTLKAGVGHGQHPRGCSGQVI